MIFVTVGTHEQQFNRLIEEIDRLVKNREIREEVIVQTGFSTYEPQYCTWQKMFSYEQMCQNVERARIVITHGGPSSFIMALQMGKIPIVVPRQKAFGEHVNDHQVDFCEKMAQRQGNILLVTDIRDLKSTISDFDRFCGAACGQTENNNARFCEKLGTIVAELLNGEGK